MRSLILDHGEPAHARTDHHHITLQPSTGSPRRSRLASARAASIYRRLRPGRKAVC